MKSFLIEYNTTNGKESSVIVKCSSILSLYQNVRKEIPDLREIIAAPIKVNVNKEKIIDLTKHE